MTDPLPRGQQMLLQRLMAEHTMTDEQADAVLQQLVDAKEDLGRASTITQCFSSINQQLKKGFGLEIMTMISSDDNNQKIHAVVCADIDTVAKESFAGIVGYNERKYLKVLLESLVEGPSVRSTLINLRTEDESVKLDLDAADKFLETLLDEHWLAYDTSTSSSQSQQRRRESMNAKITLGPRAFLELNHVLTDAGYPKEELPQFVFHH